MDNLVHLESAQKVKRVFQVCPANKAALEDPDLLEYVVKKVFLALMEHLDQREIQASKVNQELLDPKECWDQVDSQASQETREIPGDLVQLDFLEQRAERDSLV